MLKNLGRPSLLLKLGNRICVCLRKQRLNAGLRARIRPILIGGFACWFDKSP